MIYITGDLHGHIDIHKLNTKNFPEQKDMAKDDYLIIVGDFGLVWDNSAEELYWRNWLATRNYTTLWIDGNHENFELLKDHDNFPIVNMFGGKVQKINDSIYHLLRGEYYEIDGKTFFTFGGARSTDKEYRKLGSSWWFEEMPNWTEYNHGLDTIEEHPQVDYILTHCAPRDMLWKMRENATQDNLTSYLQVIMDNLSFKQWYCGHYHIDKQVTDKFRVIYRDLILL